MTAFVAVFVKAISCASVVACITFHRRSFTIHHGAVTRVLVGLGIEASPALVCSFAPVLTRDSRLRLSGVIFRNFLLAFLAVFVSAVVCASIIAWTPTESHMADCWVPYIAARVFTGHGIMAEPGKAWTFAHEITCHVKGWAKRRSLLGRCQVKFDGSSCASEA